VRGLVSSAQCINSFFFFVGALLLVLVLLLVLLLLLLLTFLILLVALALLVLLTLLTLLVLLVRILLILLIGHLDVSLKPHAECRGHGHPLQALVNHACVSVEDGITALSPHR
jgi:hypothetical protein